MKLSNVRRNTMELTQPQPNAQLSFDDALMTEEELDAAAQAAEQNFREQVSAARVVLIPYMSNPRSGILGAFWGDAYLVDNDGHLGWMNREALPVDGLAGGGDAAGGDPSRPPIEPLGGGTAAVTPRFDDGELEEPDIGVKPPVDGSGPGGDTSNDG